MERTRSSSSKRRRKAEEEDVGREVGTCNKYFRTSRYYPSTEYRTGSTIPKVIIVGGLLGCSRAD
jgi:hypothetical protein